MTSDTTSQRRDGQELAADVDALANQAVLADVEQEAKSRSGKDAADRRLPLIARIYGVLVLLQGVITLPVIVLMAGYSVHEILDGRVTVDVLNLTFILTCAQTVVSSANAACLTVLGVLLIRNRRRYSAWWSYIVMMVTFAEGLLSLALDGLGANLLVPSIQMTILVALAITLDPTLLEERRLQRALKRMDERDEYEAALAKGVKVTGATVHFVSEVVDGGAIIAQKAVEVEPGDTPESLQKRVMQNAEWILLPQAVSDFCAGRLSVSGAIVTRQE